jgi:capsular exopolysaccharide synthesis family protein
MELVTDKMREVDVAASLMTNTVQVVDRAQTPRHPSKPNKKMVLLLSFMLGLMGSAGSVLALQVVDRRVKDPEVLEKRFGLPLLCAVPTHTEETRTFAVEAFLNLRTSLLYASDHKARKTWMVVSSSAAEGKSAVSANLAITMASAGDRVLLIDGDLRKPTLHNYFKQDRAPGLPEFLAQASEDYKPFLRETGKANLWLMPAGKTPPNPPILFDTDKFLRFVANVRHDFDWVIFDTPPTLAVTDSLRLAEHAEGIVLVARYRKTVLPLVERTLAEFARVGKPVTGVVLNQFEWNRHFYYQNYYYRHYRYYYAKDPPLRFWGKVARALRHAKKTTSTGAGPAIL